MHGYLNRRKSEAGVTTAKTPPWAQKRQQAQAESVSEVGKPKLLTPDAFDATFGGKSAKIRIKAGTSRG